MTMPQIGPVTVVAFVATLNEAERFRGAHQVEAYLRLVPREWSSSEVQRRGPITTAGNSRMRWLLVEAAWRLATHRKRPETEALQEWTERIARRRGSWHRWVAEHPAVRLIASDQSETVYHLPRPAADASPDRAAVVGDFGRRR